MEAGANGYLTSAPLLSPLVVMTFAVAVMKQIKTT